MKIISTKNTQQSAEKLLKIFDTLVVDFEIFTDINSLKRISLFLHAWKSNKRQVIILKSRKDKIEKKAHNTLLYFGLNETNVFNRAKSLYQTYSQIHELSGKINPNWIECRKTLYINYYRSKTPIHIPKELNVFSSLVQKGIVTNNAPIICPLKMLRTCNVSRNCVHNCIFCYVPHSGAPKMPFVLCANLPEVLQKQIENMKKRNYNYVITDFGSLTDIGNNIIDDTFQIYSDTLKIMKRMNYPILILTKGAPSESFIKNLNFKNALLCFSLYNLDQNKKKEWEPNTAEINDVKKSMLLAKRYGVRTALRLDIFPGYNDDLDMLAEIISLAKRTCDVEHVVVGSFRGRTGILKQIDALNPNAYTSLKSSLDDKLYSDKSFRPKKEERKKWYDFLSNVCNEKGIDFSLCKEEADFVRKYTSKFIEDEIPICLCLSVRK